MAHRPTEETRDYVCRMVRAGLTREQMCNILGITDKTLLKHYKHEIDSADGDAIEQIATTLFQQAKAGNVAACMFWLKTRARWREVNRTELTDADGKTLPSVLRLVVVDGESDTD